MAPNAFPDQMDCAEVVCELADPNEVELYELLAASSIFDDDWTRAAAMKLEYSERRNARLRVREVINAIVFGPSAKKAEQRFAGEDAAVDAGGLAF